MLLQEFCLDSALEENLTGARNRQKAIHESKIAPSLSNYSMLPQLQKGKETKKQPQAQSKHFNTTECSSKNAALMAYFKKP
jgi:hypothetical protein